MKRERLDALDLKRINQAAERLNPEAADVLDYQTIGRLEFSDVPKNAGKSARATQSSRSIPAPDA
jgi:hypothetical protein